MAEGYNKVTTNQFPLFISDIIKNPNHRNNVYLALGVGSPEWDTEGLPTTDLASRTTLVNETFRKQVDMSSSNIEFVDPVSKEVSATPTYMIRIEVQLNANEYVGVIREHGVFAVDATSTAESGILISYTNHAKMSLPSNANYKMHIFYNFKKKVLEVTDVDPNEG